MNTEVRAINELVGILASRHVSFAICNVGSLASPFMTSPRWIIVLDGRDYETANLKVVNVAAAVAPQYSCPWGHRYYDLSERSRIPITSLLTGFKLVYGSMRRTTTAVLVTKVRFFKC